MKLKCSLFYAGELEEVSLLNVIWLKRFFFYIVHLSYKYKIKDALDSTILVL